MSNCEDMEKKVMQSYLEFRELCKGNTQMILKCFKKMKEDNILKYLYNADNLTQFELGYVRKLVDGGELTETIIYHPVDREKYEIKISDGEEKLMRKYVNYQASYEIFFNGNCLVSLKGKSINDVFDKFISYCAENKGGHFECKSILFD